MNGTNKIMMLVRREVWENRSLWIAPVAIAGVILLSILFGTTPLDGNEHFWFQRGHSPMEGFGKRDAVYAGLIASLTAVQLFALGIVVFFYLLDSLLQERKDRSILFWKSLPVSDSQVVVSKAATALLVTPLFVLAVSAVTQILVGSILWLRFHDSAIGGLVTAFDPGLWLQVQAAFLVLVPAVVVWYLPIAAYLMLVSVWARKNAFLWAVLPPVAIQLVEGLVLHSHHFGDFLGRRFAGVFMVMDLPRGEVDDGAPLAMFVQHVAKVFVHYETWLGVLAAVAIFAAVIRIRRYRDDS
jgi:ABC-2 type transport system permease protein